MTVENRIEFEKKYLDILLGQLNEGLDILNKTSIGDEKFKDIVVNINNANNIALQLQTDIIELEKELNGNKTEEVKEEVKEELETIELDK